MTALIHTCGPDCQNYACRMERERDAADEKRFLLVKRGLYYRPNNCGYTGFKEHAGRYHEGDANPASGVTAIHEDVADEIAPNCFEDLAREYLNGRLAKAAEDISVLRARAEKAEAALREVLDGTYPRPVGTHWRGDCKPTKHDRCIHDVWMYECCENCLDAFVTQALEPNQAQGDR